MLENVTLCGDCLDIIGKMEDESIDVIYLDPPFFTQNEQKLRTRGTNTEYMFSDKWNGIDEYLTFMKLRLNQCKRVLKNTGSIFVHCDRSAVHYLKILLDNIFGIENFQSDIIWYYKRWSNSKKGLLNNHQNILFYSKTKDFKFNRFYMDYSLTTNLDQILQDRTRDKDGRSKYKVDNDGNIVMSNSKKGVPLSDVWEIPYLNPKAKERVGYPTQKPIILLEQIIKLVTDENDVVMDPFMGSGTTVVAAKMLNRKYIGIDQTQDAVELANERLRDLIKTESNLLKRGEKSYQNLSDEQMNLIKSLGAKPVQRNSGIDGFLNEYVNGYPVSVRIQRQEETLSEAVGKLLKSSKVKKCTVMIMIRTHLDMYDLIDFDKLPDNLIIIEQYNLQIKHAIDDLQDNKLLLSNAVM